MVYKIFVGFYFVLVVGKCIQLLICFFFLLYYYQGLVFLYNVRYLVYWDIKLVNLLINFNGEFKIIDFGISLGFDNFIVMVNIFL